jgi:uncharacterized protein (TIGR02147 family)
MRAYARDVGILPSRMSEIMSGKKGFSVSRASKIASYLRLQGCDLEIFMTSVAARHSRSESAKRSAQMKFERLVQQDGFGEFEMDKFKIVSDWHHIGILMLLRLKDFSPKAEWIAQRLGIGVNDAQNALERLMTHQLLHQDENGSYRLKETNLATPSDIPTEEIRKFHRQILKKAEQALEKHSVEARDFSSVTMAIHKDKVGEAKTMIREFRRKFCRTIESTTSDADRVYSINIQFFPMDEVSGS